jgi:hypothetical protein
MIEMIRRLLRQKLGSPGTVIALLLLALLTALPLNAQQSVGLAGTLAIFVLAGGCVSRDAASGALQMILARPIRRTDYLAGRYLGILIAQAVFLAACVLLAGALGSIVGRLLHSPASAEFSFPAAGRLVGQAFLEGALLAAILLFFSTFLRGWGDILAFVLAAILLGSLQAVGQVRHLPALEKTVQIVKENLSPSVSWDLVFRGQSVSAEALGRYVLALVLYWTLAAVIFSRREFSYGQD